MAAVSDTMPTDAERLARFADIDRLIVGTPQGHVASRVVFTCVMFFDGGGEIDRRVQVHNALMDYADRFNSQITHNHYPGATTAPGRIEWDEVRREGERRLRSISPEEPVDIALFGQPFNPRSGGIGLFGGSIVAATPDPLMPTDISIVEFSVAPSWAAASEFNDALALVQEIAAKVKPLHGLAGFGVQFDRIYESSSAQAYSFPLIKRFPGLHCGLNNTFTVEVQRAGNLRLFSTNWLTILGDQLAASLGDVTVLSKKLGPPIPIHEYAGGRILQAGQYPQLGDTNRGLVLDEYRRVAQLLKPLVFDDYKVGLFAVEEPLDSLEETKKWIDRFD